MKVRTLFLFGIFVFLLGACGDKGTNKDTEHKDTGIESEREVKDSNENKACDKYKKKDYIVDGGQYRCKSQGSNKGRVTLNLFTDQKEDCAVKARKKKNNGKVEIIFTAKANKIKEKRNLIIEVEGSEGSTFTCALIE
jgi:hypothetical protein